MFSVDFDAEWEKEQLLKGEGAGSPKAELSQWNRLFSMNRHRWTSRKPHAPGSVLELESKEEPLLNTAANTPATPVLPLPPANPSDVVLVERFGHPTRRECQGWAGSSPANPWQIQDSNPCPGAAGAWVAVGGRGWHSPAVNPGHDASSTYMPPTAQSGSPQRCLTIRRM
ncbi:uncharacterized protein ACIBXB_019145 isoform 2-T2 [Morphnus guianensis]